MKAKIEIVDPSEVVASITLTMTVQEWKALKSALDSQPLYGPAQRVRDAVFALTCRVEQAINFDAPEESQHGSPIVSSGRE